MPGERALVFLPMAHSFQRYASYLNLVVDVDLVYGGALHRTLRDIEDVQPSCFAVVPSVLERLRRRILDRRFGRAGAVREAAIERAVAMMNRADERLRAGFEPGIRARLKAGVADRIIGRRVRKRLGGQLKFIGVGGASLSPDTEVFFEAVGVSVLAGYGATETCAPACLNALDSRRFGTVGRPLPGTEVRIADDGEILVRGPGVFSGYVGEPRRTAEAFDGDGWFRTGDIGSMSRDGFLTLSDRKSDVIVTAGGESVLPQPLELALARHPWVERAVVVGQGRPYLGALLTLDPEVLPFVAARIGLGPSADAAAVCNHPIVTRILQQHLAATNADQPERRQIHRFSVLAEKLTTAGGELTPTFRTRRQVVAERHGDAIERLYRT